MFALSFVMLRNSEFSFICGSGAADAAAVFLTTADF